ncbi:MAG: hypothetical protein IK025_01515 [Bacteroidales bacterium]|nr:hypothetical protein [Bacteroidales bacterium]
MRTKTITIALAITALTSLPFFALGQEQDSIINNYDYSTEPRNEISTSIGTPSGFGSIFDLFKVVIEGVANGLANNYKTDTKFVGTYGLDYYYQVNSWLRPGAKIVYEGLTTSVYDTTNALVNHYNTSTLSVMPSVQFSYLNRKYVKLYSGIDLGVAVIFDDNKQGSSLSTTLFAFNITPIGIRVGNDRIFGLVETNIGMDALIKGGFGVRF